MLIYPDRRRAALAPAYDFVATTPNIKDEAALHPFNPQPYGEIHVMRANGSDRRVLTDNQFEDGTPTWIPWRQ